MIRVFWFVLTYNIWEHRRIDDVTIEQLLAFLLYKTLRLSVQS